MKHSHFAPVIAYIGLGSNLAKPVAQIKSARTAIAAIAGAQEVAFSGLYHSLPMGPQDQPDYVNAVMGVETGLLPMDLLHALQNIDRKSTRLNSSH